MTNTMRSFDASRVTSSSALSKEEYSGASIASGSL